MVDFLNCKIQGSDLLIVVLNLPTVVLVEVLECCIEVFLSIHLVHVNRRGDELVIVDQPIAICISLDILKCR
jgi:hypothetical protein